MQNKQMQMLQTNKIKIKLEFLNFDDKKSFFMIKTNNFNLNFILLFFYDNILYFFY